MKQDIINNKIKRLTDSQQVQYYHQQHMVKNMSREQLEEFAMISYLQYSFYKMKYKNVTDGSYDDGITDYQ